MRTAESKFEIFSCQRRVYERRKLGERLIDDCVLLTVKHHSGYRVGVFGREKAGELIQVKGTIEKERYHSILKRHTIPSGLHVIREKSPFNKTTVQNAFLNYGKITLNQKKKKEQNFGYYDLAVS